MSFTLRALWQLFKKSWRMDWNRWIDEQGNEKGKSKEEEKKKSMKVKRTQKCDYSAKRLGEWAGRRGERRGIGKWLPGGGRGGGIICATSSHTYIIDGICVCIVQFTCLGSWITKKGIVDEKSRQTTNEKRKNEKKVSSMHQSYAAKRFVFFEA